MTDNNINQHEEITAGDIIAKFAELEGYAPFVTKEKFARLVGLTPVAVGGMIQRGQLPMLKRSGERALGKAKPLINMEALKEYAQEQAQVNKEWQSSI